MSRAETALRALDFLTAQTVGYSDYAELETVVVEALQSRAWDDADPQTSIRTKLHKTLRWSRAWRDSDMADRFDAMQRAHAAIDEVQEVMDNHFGRADSN